MAFMTEKEKMLAGEVYSAVDQELIEELMVTREVLYEYNTLRPSETQRMKDILNAPFMAEMIRTFGKVTIDLDDCLVRPMNFTARIKNFEKSLNGFVIVNGQIPWDAYEHPAFRLFISAVHDGSYAWRLPGCCDRQSLLMRVEKPRRCHIISVTAL